MTGHVGGMTPRLLCLAAVAAVLFGLAPWSDAPAVHPAPAMNRPPAAWTVQPSPDTSPALGNALPAVSCTGPATCMAVGSAFTGSVERTLIEAWDGSTWSIVASPNFPTGSSYLLSVSCVNPASCFAVGYDLVGAVEQPLIESWDGSTWSIVPSPSTSTTQNNVLSAVTCSNATSCVAVGSWASNDFHTLIEQWDGSAWAIVPSPNTSDDVANQLFGVSCRRPAACTAVGYTTNVLLDQTLIESWNGRRWTIAPSPDTSTAKDNLLWSVSCPASSACTAVGYALNGSSFSTLIESWNGSAWSIVSSPDLTGVQNFLLSVSCRSVDVCTAVGYDSGATVSTLKPLVETWDGAAWAIISSPAPGAGSSLRGLSCRGRRNLCFAVGRFASGSNDQTLIESNGLPVHRVGQT